MIWFDLDNSPHVPLFRPILNELSKRGEKYFVTARDFAQTKELLNLYNINYELIGKHAGKKTINKILNLFTRSLELRKVVKDKKISLAISHGSRTQLLTAKQLGIKSLLMLDYEYTESKIFNTLATNLLIPVYIPDDRLEKAGFNLKKVIRYNGFKEELYLTDFQPQPDFRKSIGIEENQVLIVLRPPSLVSNYHNSKSELLLKEALSYFTSFSNALCLVVSRTFKEEKFIKENFSEFTNIKFLDKVVDGLQLLYSADIALSGGGTMNREAALLGTETYSYFAGKRPYLDEFLEEQGRLKFINEPIEFQNIKVERKPQKKIFKSSNNLVEEVINIIGKLSNHNDLIKS